MSKPARISTLRRFVVALAFVACSLAFGPRPALAWGDEGQKIIALVANRFLDPAVREKIVAMIAADPDNLTAHDIASEAAWADRYRDSDRNGSRQHYEQTWRWHFVNIELADPKLVRACFGHPPLPAGTVASNGSAQACVVDKFEQFAAELADPRTDPEERLVALKFALHSVGDLHQPLHAADDHDAGGNRKRVAAQGFRPGNLHHFWDTEWVQRLGTDPRQVADVLTGAISDQQRQAWSQGTAAD
jgi:S1/P1 Nuclease